MIRVNACCSFGAACDIEPRSQTRLGSGTTRTSKSLVGVVARIRSDRYTERRGTIHPKFDGLPTLKLADRSNVLKRFSAQRRSNGFHVLKAVCDHVLPRKVGFRWPKNTHQVRCPDSPIAKVVRRAKPQSRLGSIEPLLRKKLFILSMNESHCKLVVNALARSDIFDGDGVSYQKLLVEYSCSHIGVKVGPVVRPAEMDDMLALECEATAIVGQQDTIVRVPPSVGAQPDRGCQVTKIECHSVVEAKIIRMPSLSCLDTTLSHFENKWDNIWPRLYCSHQSL